MSSLNRTVVVVDPDPSVVSSAMLALSKAGYACNGVHGFEDATRSLRIAPPDVVVVSVELGAYNGLQLAMRAAIHHPATRVIVVGPPSATLGEEARALGASAYMQRPLTAGALIEQVSALAPARSSRADSASGRPRQPVSRSIPSTY